MDLKELEKFGFKKLDDNPRGHKYSWKEEKYNWEYEIYINKDNIIRITLQSSEPIMYAVFANKLQTKLFDLYEANLVEKVSD